ncbi:GPI-anchored cell wall organization protein ecm33 [Diplocarpon rosae]|nr:GPI-anchored cell wall organization protein ecm33 [Diplocarpon rosae]
MFAQILLPTLALLSAAAAQTPSACSGPTATINSQADVAQYTDCSTLSGSLVIGSAASGTIDISGIEEIEGNLTSMNAGNLVSLSSSSLKSIGGDFNLFNLTLLSTLQFNALTSVKTITWIALPALPTLTFGGPVSEADSVTISNTFLSTLTGINLETVGVLQIDNNNNLKQFDTQIANITDHLDINANGNQLAVTFPNLIWAANLTFRNVSSVKIPSLANVNGSLGFYGNYMESISAPNLTSIGNFATGSGSLAIVANGKLANITFPVLKTVGGANQIANNTALHSIEFPALTSVGGAIDFSGNFTTPELPKLENVKGGFNIQSQQAVDCSGFESQSGGKGSVIQGTFICKTTATTTTLDGSDGSSSSGASSTSTKNAAVSYGVADAVAGLSVIGGLLQMLL